MNTISYLTRTLAAAIVAGALGLTNFDARAHSAADCAKALEGISANYRTLYKECTFTEGRFLQGIPSPDSILTAEEMESQKNIELLQKSALVKSNGVLGLLLGEDSPDSIAIRQPRITLTRYQESDAYSLSIDGNSIEFLNDKAEAFNAGKYEMSGIVNDQRLRLTFAENKLVSIDTVNDEGNHSLPNGTDFNELQKSFNSKYKKINAISTRKQVGYTNFTETTHRWVKDGVVSIQIAQVDGVITNRAACLALASQLERLNAGVVIGVKIRSECLDGKTAPKYKLSYFHYDQYKALMAAVANKEKMDKAAAVRDEAERKRKGAAAF